MRQWNLYRALSHSAFAPSPIDCGGQLSAQQRHAGAEMIGGKPPFIL